jgi:hypothetical protein
MVLEELENGGVTSVAVADLATTTNWVEPTFYCPPAAAAFEALHFYYGERYSLDIGPGTIAFSSGKGGIGVLNF